MDSIIGIKDGGAVSGEVEIRIETTRTQTCCPLVDPKEGPRDGVAVGAKEAEAILFREWVFKEEGVQEVVAHVGFNFTEAVVNIVVDLGWDVPSSHLNQDITKITQHCARKVCIL